MAEKPYFQFKECNPSNFMYGRTKNGVKHKIQWIVIHFTAGKGDTAKNNADYFARCSGLNASAHFFVDENEIWQTVNLANTAWHCGSETGYYYNSCRNVNSIGIEMCSDWKNGEYVITMETQKRTVKLVQWKL
jgi:N-acetylmuramoyl-L-alanine amidase CwlA